MLLSDSESKGENGRSELGSPGEPLEAIMNAAFPSSEASRPATMTLPFWVTTLKLLEKKFIAVKGPRNALFVVGTRNRSRSFILAKG